MISKCWSKFRSSCRASDERAGEGVGWAIRKERRLRGIVLAILLAGLSLEGSAASLAEQAPKPGSALRVEDVLFEDERGEFHPALTIRAGGEVLLTFSVVGFGRQRIASDGGLPEDKVHLLYEAEMRDPEGVLVEPAKKGEVDTILGPRDEQWRPKIHWKAAIPAGALGGEYKVDVRVRDAIGDQTATRTIPIRVRGENVRPAESLEVQQLEYANSENGPWFPRRAFARSDTIRVRYKIVGFRVSPEKEVWVEEDWTVLNPEGKVVVAQANAVVEKQQSFYPPRFLSAIFDLSLKDPKPGEYTLRIDVRDRIGEQAISSDSSFVLRP